MNNLDISDSLGAAIESYYTNQLTQQQAEELLLWLSINEENRQHFREIGIVWYASSQLGATDRNTNKALKSVLQKIEENNKRSLPKPELRISLSMIYRMTACVFLITLLGIGSYLMFRDPKIKTDISHFEALAPKGSRSFVILSDGSTVWLNSGTKIRYQSNFGLENRDIYLEGEAYFVVEKNPEKPFRVRTSEVCITALGTAFNVKAYNEENVVETTLEKGEVRIETLDPARNNPEISPVLLKPNQKAIFMKNSKILSLGRSEEKRKVARIFNAAGPKAYNLKVDTLVDTKLSTSWKDSRWIFKSEKLARLAPILERRYDILINFRDSVLRSYKFSGTLKEESLEQVLKAMCLAAPIRYEVNHNQVMFFDDSGKKNECYKSFGTTN